MSPFANRRPYMIALIAVIMICCTLSAIQGWRAGHSARAASTFFAGLAFSALFWSQLPKRSA